MVASILSFFGSSVFGSILGVVGNWMNQRAIRKTEEMKNAHEIAMARVQIDIIKAKTDASVKLTQTQVQGAVDLQDSKTFAGNIIVANQPTFSNEWINKLLAVEGGLKYVAMPLAFLIMGPMALVDIIKGFMRPVLTMGFTFGFGYLTYVAYTIIKAKGFETLSPEQAVLYFTLAMDTCIMLASTSVTWWFGDRRAAKSIARMTEQRLRFDNADDCGN
jgi:hypothetical protein